MWLSNMIKTVQRHRPIMFYIIQFDYFTLVYCCYCLLFNICEDTGKGLPRSLPHIVYINICTLHPHCSVSCQDLTTGRAHGGIPHNLSHHLIIFPIPSFSLGPPQIPHIRGNEQHIDEMILYGCFLYHKKPPSILDGSPPSFSENKSPPLH